MELFEIKNSIVKLRNAGTISFATFHEFQTMHRNAESLYKDMVKVYAETRNNPIKRRFDTIKEKYESLISIMQEQLFWYQMGGCDE